jgi:antitoxin component YwqK of YwqJK toxin-antitoxin module
MNWFIAVVVAGALAGCAAPRVQQVGLGDCLNGKRHGPYTLQVVDGRVVVTGDFVDGRRDGTFVVYTTRGTKVAEIPYAKGAKTGTIRLWYGDFAYAEAAGRPKLEAEYANDVANGRKRSWWPSGEKRSSELFREGSLVEVEAWDPKGSSLSKSAAEEFSKSSAEADAKYYGIVESEVDAYPPSCARSAAR